ncbi:hypothetical protein SEN2437_14040 [Salmonella enterica subsp. enterica serovar Virchow]|nr:hypothetical protein SENB94_09060 [Salmonella enterica subsp. enterica serovar Virchow]CAH2854930.1 hypothetical protein SEN2437_14040 [Salmonella enterica subsp. enterica serovar Virchow]
MTNHRRIDQPQQGDGDVRKNHRQREMPESFIRGGKKRHGEKPDKELNETSALPDGDVTPYPAYKLIISGTAFP